jgi:ubiquinone biosynthesis protein
VRGPHNLWRLIRTGATFERTGAMQVALAQLEAPRPLRIAARVLGWPFQWLGYEGDPTQPPVLRALTALGPAYIKFGQLLSTRPDVVGDELAAQLAILQDKLPPFPTAEARETIERETGQAVDDLFTEFAEPIAAASLAQVHRARLADTGQVVAVKVLRPGIERAFLRDVDAFYFAARMMEVLAPFARRLRPQAVIEHFEGVVLQELDLRLEASAAAEFQANTGHDPAFRVPSVIWTASTRRVLTLEWVTGTNLGDLPALRARQLDLVGIAERIIQTFLTHALRDGFFHADMHQGNLKIGPDGALIALDFGIMGRIDAYTRRVYAEILYGFLRKDYHRVAEVHFEAGYVPSDRDRELFAQSLRSVAEPIFGQDATRISMARLLAHLFEVTERFGMETRTELILLQRTMVVVEGVARSLNPSMNMWETAQPVVAGYIRDTLGPRAVARDLGRVVRVLSRVGPLLPQMAETLVIRAHAEPPRRERRDWPPWVYALGGALVGAALVALGTLLRSGGAAVRPPARQGYRRAGLSRAELSLISRRSRTPEPMRRIAAPARRLPVLAPLLAVLLAQAAVAQDRAPPEPADDSEARALLRILEDEASRGRLIGRLREIVADPDPTDDGEAGTAAASTGRAHPPAAEPPPRPTIGSRILGGIPDLAVGFVRSAREDWEALRANARRLQGLTQVGRGDLRDVFRDIGGLFAVSMLVAIAARALAVPIFRRLGRAAAAHGLFRTVFLGVLAIAIDGAIVVGAALLAAAMIGLGPEDDVQMQNRLAYLSAFLSAGTLIVAVRAVLSPSAPELRPLPMSDATARYWAWHLGIIVVLIAFGEVLVRPLLAQVVTPSTAHATLVAIYVATLTYLGALVFLNRKEPGAHFERLSAANEDDVLLSIVASLARCWHFILLPLLIFLLHQAITSGEAALPLLVGTAQIAAALALGVLVVALLNRLADQRLGLPIAVRRSMPLMEARLNAFVPAFLRFVRNVVVVLWVGFVLQVIGVLQLWDWLEQRFGIDMLGATTTLIVIVLVGFVVWLVVTGWIDYKLAPHRGRSPTPREQTLLSLFRNVALVAILVIGLAYGLAEIGISVAPLLASAGVIGLAISWGSQKLVQDVITGVFIQLENAINVGDVVEAGGKIGTVEKLTIRSVSLRDVEGVYHVIPFSSVDLVSNYMKGFSYYVADVSIAYRGDIDAAKAAMLAGYDDLKADAQWGIKLIGDIEWFGVQRLSEAAVVLRARLKTRPGEQWGIGRAYIELVKKRFDAAGVQVPSPNVTVWFGARRDGGEAPASEAELPAGDAEPPLADRRMPTEQTLRADAPTDADGGHPAGGGQTR